MRGAIPPLPNMPSWCGAQFEKSTGTTLLDFTSTIHVAVLWFVTPRSDVAVNQAKDTGRWVLRSVGVVPQHYTRSQYRSPRIERLIFSLRQNNFTVI